MGEGYVLDPEKAVPLASKGKLALTPYSPGTERVGNKTQIRPVNEMPFQAGGLLCAHLAGVSALLVWSLISCHGLMFVSCLRLREECGFASAVQTQSCKERRPFCSPTAPWGLQRCRPRWGGGVNDSRTDG